MMYGYARCSSVDQDLTLQIDQLTKAGCSVVRSEKKSGTTTEGREELATLLQFVREGDVLVVTKIDRLARSIGDLVKIVATLREKGVTLRTVDGMTFDNSAMGQCFLSMLGVFAEFENNLRRERQALGIQKAKLAGIYKGRKPTIDRAEVFRLKAHGIGPSEIARRLRIARASYYRIIGNNGEDAAQ